MAPLIPLRLCLGHCYCYLWLMCDVNLLVFVFVFVFVFCRVGVFFSITYVLRITALLFLLQICLAAYTVENCNPQSYEHSQKEEATHPTTAEDPSGRVGRKFKINQTAQILAEEVPPVASIHQRQTLSGLFISMFVYLHSLILIAVAVGDGVSVAAAAVAGTATASATAAGVVVGADRYGVILMLSYVLVCCCLL